MGSGSSLSQTPVQVLNLIDARPYALINIEEKCFQALLDTGANISCMSIKAFKTLSDQMQQKLRPSKVRVATASGSSMTVVGQAQIPIQINRQLKVNHVIYIIQELQKPVIIGSDFFRKHEIKLEFHDKKKASVAIVHESKNIQPQSESMILVTTAFKDTQIYIEPFNDYEGWIAPTLTITDKHGIAAVLCQNVAHSTIKVDRKTQSGSVHEITNKQIKHELFAITDTKSEVRKPGLKPSDLVVLTHLDETTRHLVTNIINKYSDVFSINPNDIGHCKEIPQQIILTDPSKVACTPPYRIAPNLQPVVHEYVEKLYNANVIQKSTSPFCSPLLLVNKAGSNPSQPLVERYRVVHDFRKLNKLTVRDSYPLHNLYDLVDKVASAKIWSVIDLSSGFWNQSLHKDSRPYTAFSVPGKGHFEYTRTAQGLCNSPAAFQRLLDFVVKGIPGVYVYIDDVVIATDDVKSHLQALEQVFSRFRKYNLKCRPKKIQLVTAEINYLGYNLTQKNGIRAGQAKINCVANYKAPTTVTEVRQFLGLSSFFRRTIPEFASKAQPLTKLTRKDSVWKEGPLPKEAQRAFELIKMELIQRPCLKPPDFKKPFILTIDASTTGLGAILSQEDDQYHERPVAYGSRALNDAEKKYAPFRLEYLAMVWGCKHFKPYLQGKPFIIRTDHKPLLSFNKQKGSVYDRYLLELAEFDFKVEHIPGTKMPADGLSRQYEQVKELNTSLAEAINIGLPQLKELQKQDKFLKALAIYLKYGSIPKNEYLKAFVEREKEQAKLKDDILVINEQAYAPKGLQTNLIRLAHDSPSSGHYSTEKTLYRLMSWYWDTKKTDVEVYCKSCPTCIETKPRPEYTFPLQPLKPATSFNDRVHIDLLGPLPNNAGNKYVLIMVDAYTKFLQLAALQSKEMREVSQAFYTNWISTFGPCSNVISDLGREFHNSLWNTMTNNLGITHRFTSAYHPQSNGNAERQVRTVLEYVRKYVNQNEWVGLLSNIQFAHNTVPSSATKYSPYEAVFGKPCTLPTSLSLPQQKNYALNEQIELHNKLKNIYQDISTRQEPYFLAMKNTYDKRCKFSQIRTNDKVTLVRGHKGVMFQKFQPKYEGTYTVRQIFPTGYCQIRNIQNGKMRYAHYNNLRLLPFLTAFPEFKNFLKEGDAKKANTERKATPSGILKFTRHAEDDRIQLSNAAKANTDVNTDRNEGSHSSRNDITPSPEIPQRPEFHQGPLPSPPYENVFHQRPLPSPPYENIPQVRPENAANVERPQGRITRSQARGTLPDNIVQQYPNERRNLANRLRNLLSPPR